MHSFRELIHIATTNHSQIGSARDDAKKELLDRLDKIDNVVNHALELKYAKTGHEMAQLQRAYEGPYEEAYLRVYEIIVGGWWNCNERTFVPHDDYLIYDLRNKKAE